MTLQRGYITARYLFGVRGKDELLEGLPEPDATAQALARGLGHAERGVRAKVLAPEAARLLAALQARRLR